MGVTLNKDGTPRKIGSGKTKGAGCFAKIKWRQLQEFIEEDDLILVSRVWLRSVGALAQKKGQSKKSSPPKSLTKAPPHVARPNKRKPSLPPSRSLVGQKEQNHDESDQASSEEDYNPPVFAIPGKINEY